MNSITVSTVQNSKGTWACGATYNGHYYSDKSELIGNAQALLSQTLQKAGYRGTVNFIEPIPYEEPCSPPFTGHQVA